MAQQMAKTEYMPKMPMTRYVISKLPGDYYINPQDIQWLNYCSQFLVTDRAPKPMNHAFIVDAVNRACETEIGKNECDPYELLIDANICTPDLTPMKP